jgi:hypothetical protein
MVFVPTKSNQENKYSDNIIFQIPRKTNLAYFSLSALKKGSLLK